MVSTFSYHLFSIFIHLCTLTALLSTDYVQSLCIIGTEYLASASFDNTVRLFSLDTYKCLHVFKGHIDGVWSLCTATIPAFTVAIPAVLSGHEEELQFPEQRLLFSGSTDSTVRVWSIDTLTCLRVLSVHASDVYSLSARVFTSGSNGRFLLELTSSSADSSFCLWRFSQPLTLPVADIIDTSAVSFSVFDSIYRGMLRSSQDQRHRLASVAAAAAADASPSIPVAPSAAAPSSYFKSTTLLPNDELYSEAIVAMFHQKFARLRPGSTAKLSADLSLLPNVFVLRHEAERLKSELH